MQRFLVFCGADSIWFPDDDDALGIETYMSLQRDILM
jgi:hypothetical protein